MDNQIELVNWKMIMSAVLATTVFVSMSCAQCDSTNTTQITLKEKPDIRIIIHCSLKLLQVWRHAQLVKEYPIEVGRGGLRKTKRGDHRTPIGDYEILWMASRVSDKGYRIEHERSWCIGNRFVRGFKGPRLERLWSRAYGGAHATVMSINYPNAKNRARGNTGECIHIHSTRKLVAGDLPKSYGCIHMFPKDAMELYELVEVGTLVKILP